MSVWANTFAQTDSTASFSFSGYAEAYYLYDFAQPDDHERPDFLYNHKRHNEVNINLAFAKAAYASQKTRANFALMVGNYAQYNLAAEPTWAQFAYEANIGVKLSKTQNLWLDAGIMPSHIGFESAIGADCWTLSRSLMAENSPYFEAGAKLSFLDKNEKLTVAALLLNGWQRISRVDGYNKPAVGFQFNYKLTDQLTVNYSNFIGSDKPDDADVQRIYHNFYTQWQGKDVALTAGVDSGREGDQGNWWTPVLMLRWEMAEKWRLAGRFEYFSDPDQVLVATASPNGFELVGTSLNLDFAINDHALLRFEGRHFMAKDEIFVDRGSNSTTENFVLATALCVKF
jgi:hypothetical protein